MSSSLLAQPTSYDTWRGACLVQLCRPRSFSSETIGVPPPPPHRGLWAAGPRHECRPLINATYGAMHRGSPSSASRTRTSLPPFPSRRCRTLAPSRSRVAVSCVPVLKGDKNNANADLREPPLQASRRGHAYQDVHIAKPNV